MDGITQSLQRYLRSENLKFTTFFNSDTGLKSGNPTSTTFYLSNEDNDEQTIDVIIDIFPETNQFFLSAHPRFVIDSIFYKSLKDYERHWNDSGMHCRLSISEGHDTYETNHCCFSIAIQGLCDPVGLTDYVWERYIVLAEMETFSAWEEIDDLISPGD